MHAHPVRTLRSRGGRLEEARDYLAVEAPLQVVLNGTAFTTTMRTPGADPCLVRGLLFTEGIVRDPEAPLAFEAIPDPETGVTASLEVRLPETYIVRDFEGRRSLMATSSCGFCGTRDVRDLEMQGTPLKVPARDRLETEQIPVLMEEMKKRQPLFQKSGGCHAAAAFDRRASLLTVFEDVGRHNAVDKVIGWLLGEGRLKEAHGIVVSGRVSYEIVFKAFQARIPYLLAVSAPSSLAVEMAERFGMTVVGFCRGDRASVYSNPRNVRAPARGRIAAPELRS